MVKSWLLGVTEYRLTHQRLTSTSVLRCSCRRTDDGVACRSTGNTAAPRQWGLVRGMPRNSHYVLLDDSELEVALLDSTTVRASKGARAPDVAPDVATGSRGDASEVVVSMDGAAAWPLARPAPQRQISGDYMPLVGSEQEDNLKCIMSSALFVLVIGAIVLVAVLKNPQM